MSEAWEITVYGRVQGVGFRYSARREAARERLTGWVRNEYDGSVRLFVQGESRKVQRYLSWLAQGPSMAYVQKIDKTPAETDPSLTEFSILF